MFHFQPKLLVACLAFMPLFANAQAAPKAAALDNPAPLQLSFQDTELVSVIEAVAKLTGKNFIIDPRVKGKVTLIAPEPMSPGSLYETLLMILKVHGFVAIEGKEATRVVPANTARDQLPFAETSRLTSERWVTEVLPVHNVSASKLVAIMRPLVAREGHLVAMAESNKLVVTDTQQNIQRIKAILARVDINSTASYELIELKYASAEEIVRTVKSVMPKGNTGSPLAINFDERTNRIILSGDAQDRMKLRALIAELDVSMPSVGRVQVIYLSYAKAKDMVPILKKISTNQSLLNSAANDTAGQGATPESAPKAKGAKPAAAKPAQNANTQQLDSKSAKDQISIEADERMNAVVISAPPQVLSALKGVIKQLDVRRAQVLIEAILVEVSDSKAAQLGVDWASVGNNGVGMFNLSGILPGVAASAATSSNPALASAAALDRGVSFAVGSGNEASGWGALLSAFQGDSESNILSTPTLLTLDNEEAEIVVGKEVPFQTGSYTSTSTSASNPFTTIERKNVGLKLKVKPQINEGNAVFLQIDQEVSDVLPSSGAVDLQTSKRQIKTNVIVGDGEVIVLGGLLSERESDSINKVPGLGDLPLLGSLFRYQDTKREKVNLMVFLRPVILRDDTMSNYYSRKKYTQLRDEQKQLLDKQDDQLVEGMHPRMPTLERWKKGEPAKPYQIPKPVEKAEPTPSSNEVVIDELLDI